jgi:hypothetical protein
MYKTWSHFNNRPAETVEDLARVFVAKLDNYLTNPDIKLVLFLFDRSTPPAKTVSRRQGDNTPKTPYELLADNFVGTQEQRAAAAWRIQLSRNSDTSDRSGLRMSASDTSDSRHYRLPPRHRSTPPGEKRTEYSYEECMENKHFKKWLSKELVRVMLDLIKLRADSTMIVSGPGLCIGKTGDQPWSTPDAMFRYGYMEVDNAVGYFSHVLAHDYDVDIESEDGDCVITSLLAAHLRISGNTHSIMELDKPFLNRVRLIRNQWASRSVVSILDINNLYITLQYAHTALSEKNSVHIENPIGNFALIAFAGGCDYVSGSVLPGVGKTNLIKTYLTEFPSFAQRLVSNHILKPFAVTIDMEAFSRYVALCFRNAPGKEKFDLPIDDIERCLHMLRETDTRNKGSPYPHVEDVRVFATNIAWTLTYFASGSVMTASVPDCSERIQNLPLYGYSKMADETNAHGFDIVEHSEDSNARYLHAMHTELKRSDPASWSNNTLGDLKHV